MTNNVRVRYAPSPTGHLHIGNARTALFNYLFARHNGGSFVIRIEDTDKKRNIEGGEESQLNYLKWLGVEWDEGPDVGGEYGPYRQSERNDLYKTYYTKLLEEGKVYKCYCTAEELEAEREAQQDRNEIAGYSGKCRHLTEAEQAALEAEGRRPSLRFHVPADETLSFDDMVKGDVSFDSDGIGGDFVIVKQDGTPTYNFAVAIDDHLMKMTHVLRGDDHISNTPKQLLIYKALGFEPPVFGHMTLIVNENRKKLSKRDESIIQFIEQYKELGYVPEALLNFITLLGWSPKEEREIYTKDEFIEQFDPARLSKSPAFFDKQKLEWMNNQYMKEQPVERVVELALPHLIASGMVTEPLTDEQSSWVAGLVELLQEKMSYGAQIVELAELFFRKEVEYEAEAKEVLAEEQVPEVLRSFRDKAAALEPFEADGLKKAMKDVQKETGHKGKKLFMPIRAVVTGQTHGPDLPKAMELLGREKVVRRLDTLLD